MKCEDSFPVYAGMMSSATFEGNVERFTGFASLYNDFRPEPPTILAELLSRLSGKNLPSLVVDLGCGTGLSTRYWADHAEKVIGLEPSDSMRGEAERLEGKNVTYRKGFSHDSGLPDDCAQIVTCSQSLHWMNPFPTFREAARILKPGGVFAAYDYDWPPATGVWEVDAAYEACMQHGKRLEREHRLEEKLRQWDKAGHLARMKESGVFRHVRELVVHHCDEGNAERLVHLMLSQGHVNTLIRMGLTERDLEIDLLREMAERLLGDTVQPWLWSSRIRLGIV